MHGIVQDTALRHKDVWGVLINFYFASLEGCAGCDFLVLVKVIPEQ